MHSSCIAILMNLCRKWELVARVYTEVATCEMLWLTTTCCCAYGSDAECVPHAAYIHVYDCMGVTGECWNVVASLVYPRPGVSGIKRARLNELCMLYQPGKIVNSDHTLWYEVVLF